MAEIIENQWFQTEYEPAEELEQEEMINVDDVHEAFNLFKVIMAGQTNSIGENEVINHYLNQFNLV